MKVESLLQVPKIKVLIHASETAADAIRSDMAATCDFGHELRNVLQKHLDIEERHLRKLQAAYKKVSDAVDMVQPEKYGQYIRFRILDGYSVEETAQRMGYCTGYVKAMKEDALRAFEDV